MSRRVTDGYWSSIKRRVWRSGDFRALSSPPPNARTLWLRLLTGPELGPIPGLFVAQEVALADDLGWPLDAFRSCWAEIAGRQMALADWPASVVWLPKAITHNPPNSSKVVLGWRSAWREIPFSPIKDLAMANLAAYLTLRGTTFIRAFQVVVDSARGSTGYHMPNDMGYRKREDKYEEKYKYEENQIRSDQSGAGLARLPDRPSRVRPLLVEPIPVDRYEPLDGHATYARDLGLTIGEATLALEQLRERHRRAGAKGPSYWDAIYCSFLEQAGDRKRHRRDVPALRVVGGSTGIGGSSSTVPPNPAGSEASRSQRSAMSARERELYGLTDEDAAE